MAERYGFLAFLSFFIPGVGQMVKGDVGKGIGILFFIIGGWFLFFEYILVMHTIFLSIIVFLALIALWVWNIYDAYTA
jgi:hypothetical protein